MLGFTTRISKGAGADTLKPLFTALVLPQLEYCSTIWDPSQASLYPRAELSTEGSDVCFAGRSAVAVPSALTAHERMDGLAGCDSRAARRGGAGRDKRRALSLAFPWLTTDGCFGVFRKLEPQLT
ncbi:hypothetical protein HPB47_010195, partial [Ixodes persulcatus]